MSPLSTSHSPLQSLPVDVLLQIFQSLNLSSIAAISQTSRSLWATACSDLVWRQVCRRLIGPWIHRDHLPTPHHPSKRSIPTDWTLDVVDRFPLFGSPLGSMEPSTSVEPCVSSWYELGAQFLLPNSRYLGWHMSSEKPVGRLVLVTFDPHSCQFLAEEIVCLNVYNSRLYSSNSHLFMPFSNHSRGFLPITCPTAPEWLPLETIQMVPARDRYMIADGVLSPHRGYQIDLFSPAYISLPWFTLSPFTPHCTVTGGNRSCHHLTLNITSSVNDLQKVVKQNKCQVEGALRVLAPRSDIRQHNILAEEDVEPDFLNLVTQGKEKTYSFSIDGPSSEMVIPSRSGHQGVRIRYQSPPVARATPGCALLAGGRAYLLGESEQLGPFYPGSEGKTWYHAIEGPSPIGHKIVTGLEGMWVGCYGTHGCEFGKLVIDQADLGPQISFIKLTGDANVPVGEVSWTVEVGELPISGIHRAESVQIDMGLSEKDGKWLNGKGRVANQMFTDPLWIQTKIQLIQEKENAVEELGLINEIRVKWIELNHISTFFRVKFGG